MGLELGLGLGLGLLYDDGLNEVDGLRLVDHCRLLLLLALVLLLQSSVASRCHDVRRAYLRLCVPVAIPVGLLLLRERFAVLFASYLFVCISYLLQLMCGEKKGRASWIAVGGRV